MTNEYDEWKKQIAEYQAKREHNGHALEDREDGLSHCLVCGGAEGSLPTVCPEVKLRADDLDAVYAGRIDYDRGPMNHRPIWWNNINCEHCDGTGDVVNAIGDWLGECKPCTTLIYAADNAALVDKWEEAVTDLLANCAFAEPVQPGGSDSLIAALRNTVAKMEVQLKIAKGE